MSFTFNPDNALTSYESKKGVKLVRANIKGYYLGLRGFIDKNGRGRWAWKIGQGIGVKGILGRCDAQSLSLAFGWPEVPYPSYFGESWLLAKAKAYVGPIFQTEKAHTFAGSTETFGNWAEPFDAYQHALDFVGWISTERYEYRWRGEGPIAPKATNFWRLTKTPSAY